MKKTATILALLILHSHLAVLNSQEQHVKTGWTFGVLPSVAFDADLGFQYGALTNVYYYGDGSTYPEYLHSIYAEAAYTTKHFGIFRLSYDSKYLIPNHRLSVDVSYLPDMLCDFYGFNGYNSHINAGYIDQDSPEYISRAYYKYRRDLFRFAADMTGEISKPWYWNAGLGVLYFGVGSTDIDRLNSFSKKEEDKLPDTTSLFDQYRNWGIISDVEARGGAFPYLHGGITYDTRDRLTNPSRGIYADAFLTSYADLGWVGGFLTTGLMDNTSSPNAYHNLKLNANFRHYVTLWPNRLTLAYRLGTQLTLAGDSPFYLNTYLNQTYYQRAAYEGLGGASSVRGMMRNRVLAPGVAFANIELRTHLFGFTIGKNYFSVGINPFLDAGMVVQPYDDVPSDPERITMTLADTEMGQIYVMGPDNFDNSRLHDIHLTGGCGLKLAMNTNFVLSVDWATAFDKQDNPKVSNLYIKMGYMF